MSNFKLCFVDEHWAYFTTQRLERQEGDGWSRHNYEDNASPPYEYYKESEAPPWKIKRVGYRATYPDGCRLLNTPAELAQGTIGSPYSVNEINQGKTPWLCTDRYYDKAAVMIRAGVSLDEFKEAVWSIGGEVYELSLPPDMKEEELVAYLAGPMEHSADYGMGWRVRLRDALKPFGIRCILPNEEEARFISGQEELDEIKKSDPQRYKNIMRQFIKQDLQFVEGVNMIITCWEGERMSGTVGEATHAYLSNQVAYLISSKPFHEIPGWFSACYQEIFPSEEAFVKFITKKYGKGKA